MHKRPDTPRRNIFFDNGIKMHTIFILFLASCGGILAQGAPSSQTATVETTKKLCGDKADIIFALDSSYSIGADNYQKMLKFVAKLTKSFDLGPKKVQFGAIIFGAYSEIQFNLTDYTDHQSLNDAIKKIHFQGSGTYISGALDIVRTKMFSPAYGARAGVTRIVIVLTDGAPAKRSLAHIAYEQLKNAGILVVAIGIRGARMEELRLMATSPGEIFKVNNFKVLPRIQAAVANKTCDLPKICTHKADIIFILDSSGSIESSGRGDYKKQLNFVSGVTQKFDLGPVRFGAVIFSTDPEKLFDLSTYSDHTKLSEAILKARYMGGQTYTNKALDMVKNGMFDQNHGGRVNATKIAIVLTDGSSNDRVGAANAARDMRSRGIRIIAIGVGPHAAQGQLSEMASSAKDVFTVTGYDALHYIEEIVAKTACTVQES